MDKSYKRKNYYYKQGTGGSHNYNNKKFRNVLLPGMKGFLCTCNSREKDCIRESYNILNGYADILFDEDERIKNDQEEDNSKAGGEAEAAEEIEDELKKEVASLQSSQSKFARFNVVDTGVKNNIFIKTTLEDPVKLALTLMNDIAITKDLKARFVLRIVPVEVTCKANLEDIKSAADALFDKHFRCEPTTFAVVVNKRYNDSILRDELIHAVALLVTDKNREHKANLKDAKMTVLLEIMKGLCCISVLEDYKKLRHYNLAELAKPDETNEQEIPKEADEGTGLDIDIEAEKGKSVSGEEAENCGDIGEKEQPQDGEEEKQDGGKE